MAVAGLRDLSQKQDGFYVPCFEVLIEKAGLSENIVKDVLQVTYKDNIKEIDSFEISVNNWDPEVNRFKYLGAESQQTSIFEPSDKKVTISMGYAGKTNMRVMLTGNITTMEPNFPGSGAPTLTVRGLNVLHQLRTKQYTYAWTKKKDSEIADDIQTLRDEKGNKRFPLPIKTKPDNEPELDHVSQDNQYDIDFLLSRARQRGYVVLLQEEDKGTGTKQQLYFGPSQEKNKSAGLDDIIELEWGLSLLDFKPTLTSANQIRSVTVKGWDRRTKQPITETVTLDDTKLKLNPDLLDILKKCNPREEMVVDEPVFTRKQARERAKALLLDRHKEMVKAGGSTVGLPDLRAGKRIMIKGFGPRFSGIYFVTETTHIMDNNGYITRFQARREDAGEGKKA